MSSFSNDSFNTGNGAFNENNWPTGRGPFDAIVTSESSRFVVHTSVERAVSAESIRATTLTNGQTTTTWVSMLMQVPVAGAASTATYAMTATSALSAATAQIAETARYAETAYAATVATNASSAMYATSAGHASSADTAAHASFATYATSAGYADAANTAVHASDASYASEAFAAYHASFADSATTATYAERVRVMNSSGGTLWTSAVNTDSVSSADIAGTANNVYAKNSTGGVTQTSCIDTVYSAYSAGNAVLANRAFEAAEADRASSAYSVRVVTRDNENNTGTQYTDVINKVSQAWWADSAARAATAYTASSATFANYAKSVRVQTNTASTDTEWRGIIDLRSVDPSLYTVASASSAASFVSSDSTYAISDTSAYVDTSIANSANYVRSQTGSLVSETAWVTAIGDARSAQYATSAGTATVANSFTVNGSSVSIGDAYTAITHDTLQVSESVSSNNTAIAQISSDVGNKSLLDTNNKTNLVAAVNEVNAKVDSIPTGLVPQGTIAFEDLPDLADVNVGWMYNISDDFTTDNRFIIPGIDERAGSNVYAIEDTEATWSVQSLQDVGTLNDIIHTDNLFIAVGASNSIISTDGTTWATHALPAGALCITKSDNLFVAGGQNCFLTSTDGITWTEHTLSSMLFNAVSIVYGNGVFVAVGSGSQSGTDMYIMTSNNGNTWTIRMSPVNKYLKSVTYGNGLFVAIGETGTILTSSDGITWTQRTAPSANTLNAITYGNGLFVAVGPYGLIWTSSDGTTWTKQTPPVTNLLYDVTYGNNLFLAVGARLVLSSADGITWTQQTPSMSSTLKTVAAGNGVFIAINNNRDIMSTTLATEKKWDVFAAAPIIQVDQTYSSTSGNPQSGTAVNEAIQQVTSTLAQLTVSSATYASVASNADNIKAYTSYTTTTSVASGIASITRVSTMYTNMPAGAQIACTGVDTVMGSQGARIEIPRYSVRSDEVLSKVAVANTASQAYGIRIIPPYSPGVDTAGTYCVASNIFTVGSTYTTTEIDSGITFTRTRTGAASFYAKTAESFVSSDSTYAISDTSAYITVPEQATVVSSASTAGTAKALSGSAFTVSSASTAGTAKALSGSAFTVSSASSAGYIRCKTSSGVSDTYTVYTSCIDTVFSANKAQAAVIASSAFGVCVGGLPPRRITLALATGIKATYAGTTLASKATSDLNDEYPIVPIDIASVSLTSCTSTVSGNAMVELSYIVSFNDALCKLYYPDWNTKSTYTCTLFSVPAIGAPVTVECSRYKKRATYACTFATGGAFYVSSQLFGNWYDRVLPDIYVEQPNDNVFASRYIFPVQTNYITKTKGNWGPGYTVSTMSGCCKPLFQSRVKRVYSAAATSVYPVPYLLGISSVRVATGNDG